MATTGYKWRNWNRYNWHQVATIADLFSKRSRACSTDRHFTSFCWAVLQPANNFKHLQTVFCEMLVWTVVQGTSGLCTEYLSLCISQGTSWSKTTYTWCASSTRKPVHRTMWDLRTNYSWAFLFSVWTCHDLLPVLKLASRIRFRCHWWYSVVKKDSILIIW